MANLSEMMSESARHIGGSPMGVKEDALAPTAETDGSTLFFNRGFMSQLESAAGSDGVRFVVAHELGHQVGGMAQGGHSGEYMADAYGAQAVARSGGSFASISAVFSFLGGMGPDDAEHPSASSRSVAAHTAFVNAKAELASAHSLEDVSPEPTRHDRDVDLDLMI